MQFTRNTSSSRRTTGVILKIGLLIVLFIIAIIILSRVDFPAPKKETEKVIPNENFKIVK